MKRLLLCLLAIALPLCHAEKATAPLLQDFPRTVHAVMDLDYDLLCFPLTKQVLAAKMRFLAECGFRRLYIVAPPPGAVDYSVPMNANRKGIFLEQSKKNLDGTPLKYAIQFAKEAGLETYVEFKPYEGGGSYSIPHGATPPLQRNFLDCLGGRAVALDDFLIQHPEMRVKRRTTENHLEVPVARLEFVFPLERIPGRPGLDGARRMQLRPDWQAIAPQEAMGQSLAETTIYTSEDNATYTPLQTPFEVTARLERRILRTPTGTLLFPTPQLCRVITISGLSLATPYFAVRFPGNVEHFRLIPFSDSFLAAFAADGRLLPLTGTSTERISILTGKSGFERNGFEFNALGPYYWDDGWKKATLLGLARGKETYQRGAFCEAYPEVRAHWLKLIQQYIDYGCDGVELRLMSHSNGIPDFTQYGFNTPIVEEYRKRHGEAIREEDFAPLEIARIRGDFYLTFAREAAELLHKNGRKLSMQCHEFQSIPTLDQTFPSFGFWSNPKILPDVQQIIAIADEIVIKDFNWGVYSPVSANAIKDAVVAAGKPLFITTYLEQGHDLNPEFLQAAAADKRVSGLNLYEVVYRPGKTMDGIVDLKPDGTPFIVPGSPFDKARRK